MELTKRKNARLKDYDYSQNNAYFITIFAHNRQHLLGDIRGNCVVLSDFGQIVNDAIMDLPNHNPHAEINNFVIMPNHLHCIITIRRERFETVPNPPIHGVPEIIRQLKTFSSRRINELRLRNGYEPFPTKTVWQKSYHDHVIRNDADYLRIWQYIDENPAKWDEDEYNKGL